jgi:murein L,D-transpeptidase YcbB/YkuD
VRPDSIDWTPVEDDTFEFIVRQDSGPENPLGRIKFMCPNEYDVYLHDTPARQYFQAGARDRSHGCVRVENPIDLAQALLMGSPQGSRDSIEAITASGNWRRLRLERHVPVHVMYWTAWVDSAGRTQFRDDVYSLDRRLDEALRSGKTSGFVINPAIQWGEKHRETVAPEAMPVTVVPEARAPALLRLRSSASPSGVR